MAEIFVDSLYDAVLDCLKVVPILFLAYLLVSYMSHDHSHKFSNFLMKGKKKSVIYASFFGCIPQCGFSSVMADLYSRRSISLGALIAVFIATSDEAIPMMLAPMDGVSYAGSIFSMLILIVIKVFFAIFWGIVIDYIIGLISKMRKKKNLAQNACGITVVHEIHNHSHDHHHECGHIHSDECDDDCGHKTACCVDNIFVDAFKHTFEIVIYIFIATFVINWILGACGTDFLQNMFTSNSFIQILVASVIGLIPNCAASVLLVEFYMTGAICFPALVAGLSSCAGVAMVILWTRNHHPIKNLGIIVLQYVLAVITGSILAIFDWSWLMNML